MAEIETIGSLVRRLESSYISGNTTSSKYVTTSLSEDVNRVYAYLEGKHTTGDKDSLDREKPFLNVSVPARNIWFRATNIGRKHVRIKTSKSRNVLLTFVATSLLQDWMKRNNFGGFLNDWGINSAGFNESVLKFVEKDGELISSVTPWNRIICDPINFKDNPKIEVLELTEAQLYKNKSYAQDKVKGLCDAVRTRETSEKQRKDNKTGYIKLYEVHGEFSQAVYKKANGKEPVEGDDDIFFQQVHVISYVASEKEKGVYDDFTLYVGKEEDPYMLVALLPEIDGSIALRGAVKLLFDVQWMVNHTAKNTKDLLDLASKLIFQTPDPNFVGQNALSSVTTGDILIHEPNMPLTQLNNTSHDTAPLQNFGNMWKQAGNENAGISESMLGINPPSGSAWRQTQAILQESHSLFDIMIENRKLAIEQILRERVLPFLKKKMDTSEEISATLEEYGIDKIEEIYVKKEATKRMIAKDVQDILNNKHPQQDMMGATQSVKSELSPLNGQRFFKPSNISNKTWKTILKDLEWDVEVVIPEENSDPDILTGLNTLFQTLAALQGRPLTGEERFVLNQILNQTGIISPIQISQIPTDNPPPTPTPMNPVAAPAPAGGGSIGLPVNTK